MPDFDCEALKPAVEGRRPPMPADVFARVSISYQIPQVPIVGCEGYSGRPRKIACGRRRPEVRLSLAASPAPHPVEGQRPQTDASLHTFG